MATGAHGKHSTTHPFLRQEVVNEIMHELMRELSQIVCVVVVVSGPCLCVVLVFKECVVDNR